MSVKQRNVIIERGVKVSGGSSSSGGDFAKQAVQVIREMNDKREHEKQELQFLNQRFSSYVERVRALEAMNRKLLAAIDELKSKWGLDSNKIKDEMEPELLKVRETIDEVTKLKAIAEIKAKRAESDALQFRHLMDLAMDSFNTDKNKIQNLERLLDNTRQDVDYLKSQLNDINMQIAKYIEEQKRLFDQLRSLKDDLDKETIDRVAKQNEVQTLEEQIAFLKAVHEQEVSELSRLQTIVGFDPAQFYRTELERAIRDIRGDFEQLNQEQKRELEEWYRIKTEEVEKEVAKERELQRISQTGLSSEDSQNLKVTHAESQREYVELQRRHSELSARLRELEEKLESTKSINQIAYAEKDREIALLREKISELMATYDELMSRKTSLEFEINTYRRLLECEETRLVKSSSSSSSSGGAQSGGYVTTTITRTTTSGGSGSASGSMSMAGGMSSGMGGGVINSSSSSSSSSSQMISGGGNSSIGGGLITATIVNPTDQSGGSRSSFTSQRGSSIESSNETITKRMQVQRTSKGPVGIKEISPDGKFVLIENTGKRGDIDISKWQIKRKVDNEPEIVFMFPMGTMIMSGKTIKIWSRGQGRQSSPNEFVHEYDWRSGESMVTRLISDSGEERALYSQRSQ